jgi:hypothetical protein
MWTEFKWLKFISVLGSCEYGKEFSASLKDEVFFDHLSDYQFLK